ncbi:hypothetical protein OUZ56_009880 [Daphnia magna]|uniref:Uncharacterized protein n=1 Tax=Daphnia magna TaxID=35525 RepID=A0ABR0AH60_9CRUS|nr:hypothetical protein OUZ56_009880 [Daphnia magna]
MHCYNAMEIPGSWQTAILVGVRIRSRERLSPYAFTTVWRKWKDHVIPDALSWSPVKDPAADDECVGTELAYSLRLVTLQGNNNI